MAYKIDVSSNRETVNGRQIMDWWAFVKGWYNGTREDGAVGAM